MSGKRDLAAGPFAPWLLEMQAALRGDRASEVPCGDCTACCTSSQFIHIGPDETDTLAHIPAELLFPAPHRPPGYVVLGYDERGRCPMLIEDQCSIYHYRPRTCRTYDCRIFPAAGIELDNFGSRANGETLIARQARRWEFSAPTEADQSQHDAVRAASAFLIEHPEMLPQGVAATNATQRAVLAIEIHHAFLHHDQETGQTSVVNPELEVVHAAVSAAWPG